jgi:hypothetical protein
MKVGQKVRMLLDDYVFRKGDILTCCRVEEDEDDNCHLFKNEKNQQYYLNPEDYELITVPDSAVDFVDEELQLIENWSSDLKAEYLKIALLAAKEHHLKMEAMMQEQINFLTKRIQDISK